MSQQPRAWTYVKTSVGLGLGLGLGSGSGSVSPLTVVAPVVVEAVILLVDCGDQLHGDGGNGL